MKHLFIILTCIAIPVISFSQTETWEVPDNKAKDLSYFKFNDESIAIGKTLYDQNCKSCHGDPGKENYQQLNPVPGDMATDKIQHNSDGELHYKIANGRGLMPGFKNIIPGDDIWNVISYIRSFNGGYVQKVGEKIILTGFTGELQFFAEFSKKDNQVKFMLFDKVKDAQNPIAGADINLFVKRNFGNLQVDNTQTTNKEGIALFKIPENLPGDTAGVLYLTAKLVNEEAFGRISKDTLLPAGMPVHPVSLTEQRAMWNVFQKAPIWLLLSYFSVVLIIWGFILYVIYHFREIYLIGKMQEEQNDTSNE